MPSLIPASAARWFSFALIAAAVSGAQTSVAPTGAQPATSFPRRYTDGQVLRYEMQGNNQGWQYTLTATDTTRRDDAGTFFEEIAWSDLQSNAPITLSAASLALRQTVSLDDPRRYTVIPDLAGVQPSLIRPITDTLTIYGDLILAERHLLGPSHRRCPKPAQSILISPEPVEICTSGPPPPIEPCT